MGENVGRGVSRRTIWISIGAAISALAFASPSFAGSFRVNSTADAVTGSPDCKVIGQVGTCTLRDAITAANADAGPNTIGFSIGGGGLQVISLGSALPPLLSPTTIDGTTQPGYDTGPVIVLDGSAVPFGAGLEFDAAGGAVSALDFVNFGDGADALYLHGGGAKVTASYFGVDSSGAEPATNFQAIEVDSGSNKIGGTATADRNVISGNALGLFIHGVSADGNVIEGNILGLDAGGTAAISGSAAAIRVDGGATSTRIGGTAAGAGNVISGNANNAITLASTTGNVVEGNLIGTDALDATAIGNDIAVTLDAGGDDNVIGSVGAGANVMAGNADVAVEVNGGIGNTIDGNLIGTNRNGTVFPFANENGIRLLSGAQDNNVLRNRISTSNTYGIEIGSGPNTISFNHIDANDGGGISVANGGGSTIGPGNTIAGNQSFGIQVTSGAGTTITQNAIDGTNGLGISLTGGANQSDTQPPPVLASAVGSGSSIHITGTLDSVGSTPFTIEFFRSPDCNPSGAGEGASYLGSASGSTDSTGHLAIDSTFPAAGAGSTITATATDNLGNTSQFSACATMSGSATATFIVNTNDDVSAVACTISHCSLREAIIAANANPGTDAIVFDIPSAGIPTIEPTGQLQTLTDPVSIDGRTQPGTPAGSPGVELSGGAVDGTANGLEIAGGGSTIRGLVINQFSAAGIAIETSGGNTVAGNYIGTDVTGTNSDPSVNGITISSSGNVIGGTTAADRNVISGNSIDGISIIGGGSTVEGNYIGTDVTGSAKVANASVGVEVKGGSGNTIGGTGAGAGNVISGNNSGIDIAGPSDSTIVQGNLIGTDATGVAEIGNTGSGIHLLNSNNDVIGGPNPGEGNTIAFSGIDGVDEQFGTGDSIRGNSMFSNHGEPNDGLAIYLDSAGGPEGAFGILPNDPQDGDSGSNNLQNYPVLASATSGGGSIAIAGSLNSVPSTQFNIDFYDNTSCDPSGSGEGQTYLGSSLVTTDGAGDVTFTRSFGVAVPLGHSVAATATDLAGNTSEFSVCATVTETPQPGPTFTVNTNADHDDGVCSSTDCTLREAINASNDQSGPNTIDFNMPGGGVQTIQPTDLLPSIEDALTIDGYTQPGSQPNTSVTANNAVLHVQLTGLPSGYGCDCLPAGFDVQAPTTVRGLVINGGFSAGIIVEFASSTGSTIAGNFIGTDATGTSGGAFDDGVYASGADHLVVGGSALADRNLISGNASDSGGVGVELTNSSKQNTVQGNLIGTNAAGTGAIPNGTGIQIGFGALTNSITGNVVAGNDGIGIWSSDSTAAGSVITGNLVGTDATGSVALGNGGDGIRLERSTGNTVGGATPAARNVVAASGGHGIHLLGANGNNVQGNYSGLNAAGTAAIGNTIDGIAVDEASNNTITGNVTSGNSNQGISVFNVSGPTGTDPSANVIRGNRTGLAATGAAVVANGGDGIRLYHAVNNTIGGVLAGQGNESAGNGNNGMVVLGATSTGNSIRGNSIHGNAQLGIDLAAGDFADGVTANDSGDADAGANNLQNFPVLASATVNAGSTRITGTLDSAVGTYVFDFYASPACDASGNGEGARWLGFQVFKTGNGNLVSIDTGSHITASVTTGEAITATATDIAGNTSEFSTCVIAQAPLAGLGLTSDEASAPAGAANIPLASVPPATLGLLAGAPIPNSPIPNSAVGAAPIPNSPIPNSPIPNSPIANSPIANSPIANSGVDGIPDAVLSTIPLSSIPIDWTPIFAGTPEANVPVQSLTLHDVFADPVALPRFNALPLSQLHLEGSVLRGVRFSSLLYGGITLDKIPPYTDAAWCAQLSSCTGIDVTKVTVLGLDVAGLLDATALGGVTVGQVRDVTGPTAPIPNSPIPNSPIPNSPIANSPIANSSVPLTAIGSVVIGTLAVPSDVVDCTKLAACLTKTLAAAAAANAIKPTATYQDLLRPSANFGGRSPLANVNFNEFAIAMIGIENLPWESWPFDGFQEFAPNGSVVHYHLTAPVPCNTAYTLRALLPHGFLVKRGTSSLAVGLGLGTPVGDPTTDPATGASWALPALVCSGTQPVQLDFQGLPGFRLGEQFATAQLIIGGSIQTANDQAPVTVTQTNEPDSDPATAPTIQPNTLAVGHIPTSSDLDWRSVSTTGLARGTKITVYLRPPAGTDLDLFLTKPSSPTLLSSPIANSPIPNSPIPNSPLPDLGGSLGATTNNPQPEGLQDAPIPNSSIASAGITRGDGVEVAQVVLGGDENGPVKILVAGYNGAHSADAYTLRVKVVTPPQLPACPTRTYAFPTVTNVGTLPTSIPSTTQNLFIMNFGATAKTYGLTAANNLLTRLQTVAALTQVKGAVLQVDGDAAVRTAKATWDASPCSVTAADDVVRKINAVVARYRGQAAGVQSITIVGGDELVPMARISDLTTDANEATAISDLLFTTNGFTRGNALFASEFLGNTLTDDAYTAGTTIPWFGRELYLPQLAGGRLVETPAEIMGQLDQYIASNGVLAPTTAVVSGYDFMKDEATQISAELRSTAARTVRVDAMVPGSLVPLIGDTWTKNDLQPYFSTSAFARGIVSANGHYNHWEAAPASPLPLTTANLVSTAVLPLLGATGLQDVGSILFTMGCHAGLNVSDAFPSGVTPERLRDWAQALSQNKAAVYVANTGYGYGDFDAIALSERLMAMFSHNLASDGSVGRKFALAKQQYFGSIASYDPYAEKALAEATFYGLPFYRLGTGADPSGPSPVPTVLDPLGTGVQVASFAINPSLTRHTTPRGAYWANAADRGVEYLKDRPVEPRLSQEVTTSGTTLRAHGVRISELTTHDVLNIDPLIATPLIDLSAHEPEALVKNVTFPATFAAIDHWNSFGTNHDSLVLDAGQTRPGLGAGETQRLVDHIKLEVLYSSSTDFAPPLLSSVGSIVNGGTATLFAHTSDSSGVARVVAFFTEGADVWRFVTLTHVPGTSDLYTGTASVAVPKIESAFFSQDRAGNVGYTTDKGTLFTSLTGDGQPPEVSIASPIDHATYAPGQPVPASFACSDDGGVVSCNGSVANGTNVDTSTLGPKSFSVTTTDLSNNTVTVTVHYNVAYTFGGFLAPIHNLPDLNVVTAGSTVPIKFTLGGNQGLLIFAPGSPSSQAINCNATAPIDNVGTVTAGGSSLSYDSTTGIYTYPWKTDKTWRGCRQLIVALKDGTTHVANFKFG